MVGLIMLAVITWFCLQFRKSRARVWARRGKAIEPLITWVIGDLVATYKMVQAHFQRPRLLRLEKHDRALTELFHGRES